MDVIHYLRGYEFEWDSIKAQSNFRKHHVTFKEAAEVFFDPFYQVGNASIADEDRSFIIGYSQLNRLLLTVYAERSDRIRIISARVATRTERKLYEET